MNNNTIPPDLRWACRRGMLELDVLLNNFLNEVYLTLSHDKQKIFFCLLESSDPDLFGWLMGNAIPDNSDFATMIASIKAHAKNRHST